MVVNREHVNLKSRNFRVTNSISIKNSKFATPFSTFVISYFSRIVTKSGQTSKQCFNVCIPLLHLQSRSSRSIRGGRLPISIFRLCEPVRYLVVQIRWNSNVSVYAGFFKVGLTCRYEPNLESSSSAACAWIFPSKRLLKMFSSVFWHDPGFIYSCCSFL